MLEWIGPWMLLHSISVLTVPRIYWLVRKMHILFQILQSSGDDPSGCAARIWPFRKRFPCGTTCFVPTPFCIVNLCAWPRKTWICWWGISLFTQLMSDDIAPGWEMRWDWLANADSLCCTLSGLTKLHTVQFSVHQIHLGKLNIPNLCLSILSQYLKNIQIKEIPILERFSLFICIALVWAYAQILTSGGAYKNSSEVTQNNCRTDRANLISSAPWLVPSPTLC